MKLVEYLELKHATAVIAGDHRDSRATNEKVAALQEAEKDAGLRDALTYLKGLPKMFFGRSPDQVVKQRAKEFAAADARTTMARMPGGEGKTMEQFIKDMEKFKGSPSGPATKVKDVRTTQIPDPETGQLLTKSVETFERTIPGPTGADDLARLQKFIDSGERGKSKIPLGILVGGLGTFGAIQALGDKMDNLTHKKNLQGIVKDPEIPSSHKIKATDAFNSLVTYAPSIAKDPIFSRDFTRAMIRRDMIDHKTVSDLIQAEKHFQEAKGKKGMFLKSLAGTLFGQALGIGG